MVLKDQTYTQREFDALLEQFPDRKLELHYGELIEKMPTQLHAFIVGMLTHAIISFLSTHPLGFALVEARYSLPDDEENDRIPDLSFVSKDKGPLVEIGPAPYMPDLAVEVQSPSQSDRLMIDKANYYLKNGSKVVWIIYPDRRLVEVLSRDERHLLTQAQTLDGGIVLPGFSVAVKDLFPPQQDLPPG